MNAIAKIRLLSQPWVSRLTGILLVIGLCTGCAVYLPNLSYNPWQLINLPTNANLLDIAFTQDPQHGWLVGTNATLFETNDGGITWDERRLDLDTDKYRLTSISFSGQEGWVVGQPSLLLHTPDGGNSWEEIPLSSKLPGAPDKIIALDTQVAEMVTNVGAIYRTNDGGKTWKGLAQEALGVFRNIARFEDGRYVAVSATGSFYSVWDPSDQLWTPHNRVSSKRVQNMGFVPTGQLWMLGRGGIILFNQADDPDQWSDPINPEFSTSWGLLDMAYRTPDEVWVGGGSGNLIVSQDGGKTWSKDREVESVPSNLDKIVFISPDKGFILGQRGNLLRYQEEAA
ncbi:MAG: photosynthesis system II assembly factor Ycf48 [Cyanobacteria bacterium REEB444]|nr:photosynthesis system II assembly factor Ycf48 [Cyanobacteria bacterium REEB444]